MCLYLQAYLTRAAKQNHVRAQLSLALWYVHSSKFYKALFKDQFGRDESDKEQAPSNDSDMDSGSDDFRGVFDDAYADENEEEEEDPSHDENAAEKAKSLRKNVDPKHSDQSHEESSEHEVDAGLQKRRQGGCVQLGGTEATSSSKARRAQYAVLGEKRKLETRNAASESREDVENDVARQDESTDESIHAAKSGTKRSGEDEEMDWDPDGSFHSADFESSSEDLSQHPHIAELKHKWKDHEMQALKWYRRAAKLGHPWAIVMTAECYVR
jgi:hypothetical protein